MSDSENRILDAQQWRYHMIGAKGDDRTHDWLTLQVHDEALRAALAEAQDALDATPPHKRAWRFDVLRLEAALATAEAERDDIIVRYGNSERVWLDERRERLAAEERVAALADYVKHKPDCAPERGFADQPCDCGLAALLVGEPDPETMT